MLNIFAREKTMSIEEFMYQYNYKHSFESTPWRMRTERPEIHLPEIQDIVTKSKSRSELTKNIQKIAVITLAIGMIYAKAAHATDIDGRIDGLGALLLKSIRKLGYWTCIVMCAYENVKSISEGDAQAIGKVSIKYAVGYLMLFVLPWVMDLIQQAFEANL